MEYRWESREYGVVILNFKILSNFSSLYQAEEPVEAVRSAKFIN